MRTLDGVSYSREAPVNAVRDFYKFLTQLHLPSSYIHEPPEGGWPDITRERVSSWGKDETVTDLLRHLPYLYRKGCDGCPWGQDAERAPRSHFEPFNVQLNGGAKTSKRIMTEGPDLFESDVPSHVVGLLSGAHDGQKVLLDTRLGIIHWVNAAPRQDLEGVPECVWYDAEEHAVSEADACFRGNSCAWAVEDFFEVFKNQFRTLEWFPCGDGKVRGMNESWVPAQNARYQVFVDTMRSFGWPDLGHYRKDECMDALSHLEPP